ncbi:hypothetical protein [Gramella sp. KN1008]|uniref:hypothetical protein n=1 Tax=Gramella sp. KN1008 TaxID=2529298 RepID=UPI00103D63B2|nr:hypothetical protein [Gramella sp. KN1008]TBW26520.1 hypothetical protein EZJ28_14040 [Gramella sp. KN1008]
MKKLLLAFCAIVIFCNSNAQELRILKGRVTDSLPISGASDNTFALYAPRDYTPNQQWPVVFVFDPQGRGATTANLFRQAAEDQQYLIASANLNLKAEPLDSIIQTATSMMNFVFNSFPVHPDLVYTAGMGEGAQVASALPMFYKKMAGVMAIGNSFVNPAYVDKNYPYMFIAVAGDKDYMVYEMEEYLRFYDDLDFKTEAYYFDGMEDVWPEAAVISNAMTGFTLEAIRKGVRVSDKDFIRKLYESEIAYTEQLGRSRNFYEAYEKLDRMEDKYEDFGFEEEIEDRMKEIKKTSGFRSQRSDFREATSFEKQQQEEYEYLLRTDIMSVNYQNIGWWAYQVDELEKLKNSPNEAKSNMAYRLHGYLDFLTKRQFDAILKSEAPIDAKIFISVLRTAIQKDDPEAYFKIISLAGSDGDYETALLYLEDLLKTGYSDIEALYNIESTLDLQFTREYNEIIKKYLGESKFYNDIERDEKN